MIEMCSATTDGAGFAGRIEGSEVDGMRRSAAYYASNGLPWDEEHRRASRFHAAQAALEESLARERAERRGRTVQARCPGCGRETLLRPSEAPEPCFLCPPGTPDPVVIERRAA